MIFRVNSYRDSELDGWPWPIIGGAIIGGGCMPIGPPIGPIGIPCGCMPGGIMPGGMPGGGIIPRWPAYPVGGGTAVIFGGGAENGFCTILPALNAAVVASIKCWACSSIHF